MTNLRREVIRAVRKKRKPADGGEGTSRVQHRPRTQSPPRAVVLATPAPVPTGRSQPQPGGEVVPVDLTAETPPEESHAEAFPIEAPPIEAPRPLDVAPISFEAEPVVGRVEEERTRAESVGGSVPVEVSPSPARDEASGGDELRAAPSRPSLMNDGRLAEQLMSHTHRPEFLMELHSQGAKSFFRDVAVAQLWVSNSVAALKDVLAKAEASLKQSQREAVELRSRAERAEGELVQAKAQLDVAKDNVLARDARLDSLRVEMEANGHRASAAEEQVRGLEADLAGERAAKQAAEQKTSAAEGKAAAAEERARGLEGDLAEERAAKQAAEQKASAAEGRAATAEERVRGLEGDLDKEKAARQAAEERISAAERRVATAIEDYEKSPAFTRKVGEASTEVYLYGFNDAKEKVGRIYHLPNLDDIEPDGESEEQVASPEPTGDEAGPGDA